MYPRAYGAVLALALLSACGSDNDHGVAATTPPQTGPQTGPDAPAATPAAVAPALHGRILALRNEGSAMNLDGRQMLILSQLQTRVTLAQLKDIPGAPARMASRRASWSPTGLTPLQRRKSWPAPAA